MPGKRKKSTAGQIDLTFHGPVAETAGTLGQGQTAWTIGHSNHPLERFLSLLQAHAIDLLVDVRRFPASRAHPRFNQEPLADALAGVGISYRAMPELGGRRRARLDSPHQAWRNESFRGYADYMDTPPFQEAVARVLDAVRSSRLALMCSEAVWWRCHRALIADYLKSQGCQVVHIMSHTSSTEHPYTAVAKIVAGRLTY